MYTLNVARRVRFIVALGMMVSMLMPFTVPSSFAQSTGKTVVYPGAVSIQAGTCVAGSIIPATVSVPSDTPVDGIFYTITQPDETGAFEIHAQVGDTYTMGDTSGTGWERTNEWNAFYRGTAPVPGCDGPTQVNQSDDSDADDPVFGVFAFPQDCGTVPYPAPTGTDVTSNIGFSNYVLTQNGVPHTGGLIELSSPQETLTLTFDWASTSAVSSGQYFVFEGPLDSNNQKVFTSATQWFPVMNSTNTAQAGCASVVGGDITVQFTEYVNGRVPVAGSISLFVQMESGANEETTVIEFDFDDESSFSIEIPGTPSGEFGKRGWFMRPDEGLVDNIGSVRWQLHVPASPQGYTNLILEDHAPADGSWTFSCAGESASQAIVVANSSQGPVNITFVEDCEATVMTLTVASVPANTSVDFYFYADITPGAEGPFYNIASAQAEEINRVELPYEVRRTIGSGIADGDMAVTPIPPAIDHAVCVDDVWVPASVTLATNQEGITYTMTPNPFPEMGGPLTVVATLDTGFAWAEGAAANGWEYDAETNTMVYETIVLNDPCDVPTETPSPTPPTVTPTVPPTEPPCIPPTPEDCEPPEDGTPIPCETPTIPAWCLETPTPPTVTELPETGSAGSSTGMNPLVFAGAAFAAIVAAAGVTIQRERN